MIPIGDRPHSWEFGDGFAPAPWVGDRPLVGDSECLLRGQGQTLVGVLDLLVWLDSLVVEDSGWGQTLDPEDGDRPRR
jgi:hypothetical protein